MWGETTRAENRGETTRGETTRGETSWGRNVLLPYKTSKNGKYLENLKHTESSLKYRYNLVISGKFDTNVVNSICYFIVIFKFYFCLIIITDFFKYSNLNLRSTSPSIGAKKRVCV